MTIEACRVHNWERRLQRMALKATQIVVSSKAELLIVGDSVMGCFSSARGMVTHLPVRFLYWLRRSAVFLNIRSRKGAATR
jgi:hypothetical protein